ncbi:MAG: hypothetical protein HC811_14385 [Flammeovirgaceae bacterium]|nr:hypothetical protein [Flammeovirgaceae bacterium]
MEKAKYYLSESEEFASYSDNDLITAYHNLSRGAYYSVVGTLDSASMLLESAKSLVGERDNLLLLRIENSLGKVYISQGKPKRGLESLFQALKLLETFPDRETEIKVRINIMWATLSSNSIKIASGLGDNPSGTLPQSLNGFFLMYIIIWQ